MQLFIDLSATSLTKSLFFLIFFKVPCDYICISSPIHPHWKPDPRWVLRSLYFYWPDDDFIAFLPAGESCKAEHRTGVELWVDAAAAAAEVCTLPAAV